MRPVGPGQSPDGALGFKLPGFLVKKKTPTLLWVILVKRDI